MNIEFWYAVCSLCVCIRAETQRMLSLHIVHPDRQIAAAIGELLLAVVRELNLFPTAISYAASIEPGDGKVNQFGSCIAVIDQEAVKKGTLRLLKAPHSGSSGRILLLGESAPLRVPELLAKRQIDAALGKPLDRDQLKNVVWQWILSDKGKGRRRKKAEPCHVSSAGRSILIVDSDRAESDRLTNFALSLLPMLQGHELTIYRTTTIEEALNVMREAELGLLIADACLARHQSGLLLQRTAPGGNYSRVLVDDRAASSAKEAITLPAGVSAVIERPVQWTDVKAIMDGLF